MTFSELKVQFYVKGQKKYEENVVPGFPGIRAYNDNDKGFDIKGNGQDRQYIAWVNTAELGAAVGSVGTLNKILEALAKPLPKFA